VTDERVVRILVDMASVEKRLLSLTQRSANDLITRCLDNGAAHVHVFSADMYVSRGDRT
jgi:hypothetical protein